jgi:AbrB family looped-hinge helix DNA binding protein
MARKLVRIRPKNQITLPADVLSHLNIREDDYVQVEVTPEGVAQIAPARVAVLGTPEAREAIRRADDDFKAGRYRVYESGEAFAKSLLSREGLEGELEPQLESPPCRPIEEIEREFIVATLKVMDWNPKRAAEKLGWAKSRLEEKLRQFKITRETIK